MTAKRYSDDVRFLMRATKEAVESGDFDRVSRVACMVSAFHNAEMLRESYEAQRADEEQRERRGTQ